MTGSSPSVKQTRRQACRAVFHAWRPLLCYHLVTSLVVGVAVSPLLLVLSYKLVEFSGEPVLGNAELAAYLASPVGAVSLLFLTSLVVLLIVVEYAGLMLLADAALRGAVLSVDQVIVALGAAAPACCGSPSYSQLRQWSLRFLSWGWGHFRIGCCWRARTSTSI